MTGTVDHWLDVIKTKDPVQYSSMMRDWGRAQAAGATASWTSVYSDSQVNCADLAKTGSSETYPPYPFVTSTVITFKNDKAAADFFNAGPFMHMDTSMIRARPNSMAGSGTGLGDHSVTWEQFVIQPNASSEFVYLAYWQCKSYVAILISWGAGGHTGPLLASAVIGRMT